MVKDGFAPEQYGEWLELACTDLALVGTDANGRPRLYFGPNIELSELQLYAHNAGHVGRTGHRLHR